MPIAARTTPLIAAALLAACSVAPQDPSEVQHHSEGWVQLDYTRPSAVDVLIVLDNSSSMAREQELLAENLAALVDVLEADDIEADYRIAITTTDAGHPSCPSTTPERGAFVLTPCTSRLDDFVADGEGGPSDVRAVACNDICELSEGELAILPTTTDEDPAPAPRPWLEFIGGRTNLPEGVDMRDAMRCFAPQGVAGCDFEAPLESMYQALLRTKDPTDPAYGFLRKDAWLMVAILTDEDDCSLAPGAEDIFSPDGDKLFWSDPNAAAPTSAVCWNAGVTCMGDPSGYDTCEAVNKDLAGNEGVADIDAVLQPPHRYAELLETFMVDKRALDPTQRPLIGIVAGADPTGHLHFADVGDTDPEFQETFGIGPGCESYSPDPDLRSQATPPARLRAMQESLYLYSICESDWSPVLEAFARTQWWGHSWSWGIHPGCFPDCALDTDASTLTLEPECIVEEHLPDGNIRHIEECARDEQGYLIDLETQDYQLPTGIDVCYATLTDGDMWTPSPNDDMSPECTDQGMNLEFKVSRRPGKPAAGGTRVTATCSLSDSPSIMCPGLEN